ncbi:MAG: GNAT family N-acetyltransferase [Pseudomonadota bacterium]
MVCCETSSPCRPESWPSLARELDRLYGGRYASLAHFRLYGRLADACVYEARSGGVATSVLLFRREKQRVLVLNEGMRLEQGEVARFADHIFAAQRRVGVIVFRAVETSPRLSRPFQRACSARDAVLALPDDVPAYFGGLGASTRKNLSNYYNRLTREQPSFQFAIHEKAAVAPQAVRDIIGLNRLRMSSLDKVPAIDQAEEERIVEYVRGSGFVGIATIGGRLCAGVIMYRQGRNFSMRILAHAAAYQHYHVGFLCAYLSICACIRHGGGGGRFFFGWGDNPYKFRLGGQPRQLHDLLIYRSRLHQMLQGRLALTALLRGHAVQARHAMAQAAKRGDGTPLRGAARALAGLRKWRAVSAALARPKN